MTISNVLKSPLFPIGIWLKTKVTCRLTYDVGF